MPSRIVDTTSFGGSADPQLSSPFFTLLPAEIRNLIYLEYWNLASTRQHIVKNQSLNEEDDGSFTQQFAHVPCSIAPGDEDIRFDRFSASEPMSPEKNAWNRRLKSEWCLHWPCEEQGRHVFKPTRTLPGQMSTPPGGGAEGKEPESSSDATASEDIETTPQVSTKAGLMDVLTTCKRM